MEPETIFFDPNDWVPNNQRLPVLVYKAIEAGDRETVTAGFEARFAEHGWPPQWRDTVFDYHHYHSTAHEVLGIASGSAVLELGGPGARTIKLRPETFSFSRSGPAIAVWARAKTSWLSGPIRRGSPGTSAETSPQRRPLIGSPRSPRPPTIR